MRIKLRQTLRLLARLADRAGDPLLWGAKVALTIAGRRGQRVHRILEGRRPAPPGPWRVCLYSHYDRDGLLAPHVEHALAAVAALGFRIHFVTTGPVLSQSLIDRVAPYCETIIHKDNYGLDFGAWRLAWQRVRRHGVPDELLLLNDSVYGPLSDLGAVFARMAGEPCDFWGITDSWDQKYHLQSYFVVLRKHVLESSAFERFWRSFWLINHKSYIVRRCEIGLTQRLLKAGFVPRALCPYTDVRTHAVRRLLSESQAAERAEAVFNLPGGQTFFSEAMPPPVRALLATKGNLVEATMNPMHHFWRDLITEFGCPFLKVDLVARNPVAIANAYQWKQLVVEKTDYDPALIEHHLYRAVSRRVP